MSGISTEPVKKSGWLYSELPLAYEDLTDEWLTDALCSAVPGAKVVGFKLGPPDSGLANRRKIVVEYNDAGMTAGLPTRLFCKATHDLANRIVLGISGGSYVETTFYAHIRPLLEIEAPISYYSRFDPETFNSLVILRDISDDVTEFCSHNTQMPRGRAESEMRLLATFHGTCYSNPRAKKEIEPFRPGPSSSRVPMLSACRTDRTQAFFREGCDSSRGIFSIRRDLAEDTALGRAPQPAAAHSGARGRAPQELVRRGQWRDGPRRLAVRRPRPLGPDVVYSIATALTTENRRAWEKDLLRYYLDQLQAAGGPAVTFDEGSSHYRQQLMSALTWWTITLRPTKDLPDMQPADITLEFIRRITQTMEDVDTLGSFT